MDKFLAGLVGFFIVLFMLMMGFGLWKLAVVATEHYRAPQISVEQEYQAYRHCLQSAGQMQCRMTPQDFVRYYELKELLDEE